MNQPLKTVARQGFDWYRIATSPLRLFPDFLIIGAQKGGTTSLYAYLVEHPDIATARRKEVHYFDQHYQHGPRWYQANFPTTLYKQLHETTRHQQFMTGEASPEYLFYPRTAEKVSSLLPNVKLIALLRNPVERAYSQYRHNLRWGHEPKTLSFQDALTMEATRTESGRIQAEQDALYHNFAYQRAAYLARGLYAEQLKHWLRYYQHEQILLIKSEDFYQDPRATYEETLAFLGLPFVEPRSLQKGYAIHNASKESDAPAKLDSNIRKNLLAYYEPHNAELYQLVGRNFGWDA